MHPGSWAVEGAAIAPTAGVGLGDLPGGPVPWEGEKGRSLLMQLR